jgi:hypothetical protein
MSADPSLVQAAVDRAGSGLPPTVPRAVSDALMELLEAAAEKIGVLQKRLTEAERRLRFLEGQQPQPRSKVVEDLAVEFLRPPAEGLS